MSWPRVRLAWLWRERTEDHNKHPRGAHPHGKRQRLLGFLGGISKNYDTNLLTSHTPTIVAEADEFDRSFLQLHPAIAAITAMDADHLDIYGTLEEYQKAFKEFASQVSRTFIREIGLDITADDTKARILSYSYDNPSADYHAANAKPDEVGHYIFDLVYPGGVIGNIRVGIPGWVNVENSVAAAAVCLCHGVSPEAVKEAIGTYSGVKRRLEVHLNTPRLSYIDDYAHHPKELESAISSMRGMFPGQEDHGHIPTTPFHQDKGFRK